MLKQMMRYKKIIKQAFIPVFIATVWISISEFVRNQILLNSYWTEHYNQLGVSFPSEPINGAMWGLWSLLFAIFIYIISKQYSMMNTAVLAWFVGFLMMWVVIGNLGVLPFSILIFALPLSILEAGIAVWIINRTKTKNT
jgi:hypothetical protein